MKRFLPVLLALLTFAACKKNYDLLHSKSGWLKKYFEELANYDDIYGLAPWHEDFDETYLTINSSKRSLKTFRELIADERFISDCQFENDKLVPVSGKKYFGAFPDFGGTEDTVSAARIAAFEELAGKKIAWAYFSNNWLDTLIFPTQAIEEILSAGTTPFIRLLTRSEFEEFKPDPLWDLRALIAGDYDNSLIAWAQAAKAVAHPLLAEFGTEVNGSWFPWNGAYYGAGTTDGYGDPDYPDGPEIFRDAYRHIIDICRAEGADNITWFYHFDVHSDPEEYWNAPLLYYPGDDYIDWLGVSTYGPMLKGEKYRDLRPEELIQDAYEALRDISPAKPYAVLEFGVTEL
ncbi:MAG TPA: hypothetical protein ENJ88_11170 [Phaeodactylibacter sp.]|nr:hypothetical protein [Phaeodactylibacter sp.]